MHVSNEQILSSLYKFCSLYLLLYDCMLLVILSPIGQGAILWMRYTKRGVTSYVTLTTMISS